MKKSINLVTIILLLIGLNVQTFADDDKKLQKKNEEIVKSYIKKCKSGKSEINLSAFNWNDVQGYWKNVSSLKRLCEKYEKADDALIAVIQKDKEYQEALEKCKDLEEEPKKQALLDVQNRVFERLLDKRDRRVERARVTANEADDKLRIATLEYIVKEYKKHKKILPVDWIK